MIQIVKVEICVIFSLLQASQAPFQVHSNPKSVHAKSERETAINICISLRFGEGVVLLGSRESEAASIIRRFKGEFKSLQGESGLMSGFVRVQSGPRHPLS